MDQWKCIKFYEKKKMKLNVHERLKCWLWRLASMLIGRTQVQLWYNRDKEGREDVNDYTRPGRPSISTTDESFEAVKKIISDNRPIFIR